jgi:micrococcal nuclease
VLFDSYEIIKALRGRKVKDKISDKTTKLVLLIFFMVILLLGSLQAFGVTHLKVVRVVDGDTVVLEKLGSVRLLSVDTPETVHPRKSVECYGPEASAFLKERIQGKRVRVVYGMDKVDKYGRALVYIYLGRKNINRELVRYGYAYVYPSADLKTVKSFLNEARKARSKKLGLWGRCYAP